MIYVALVEGVALIAAVVSFAGVLRWTTRQHARERELLVNQVCHLAGRPWREAPAWEPTPETEDKNVLWAVPEQMDA